MPRLTMSMHFYTTNPDRRLVRINNHLLHEDDWVNRDLQVIEITPTGATLDFMGKLFNMQNSSR
jgi:general secretion pathway protein B